MGGLCQRHLHMAPRVSIYAGPTYCHLQRLACHNTIGCVCSDMQCVYMCVRIVLVYSAVGQSSGE